MTINTSRTLELDIGQVVLMGYRKAGLLNEHQDCSAPKMAAGKMLLETIIKELQIYGVQARSVVLENITITAGVNTYTLASSTFDVLGSAVWIDSGDDPVNPTSVFPMTSVSREERQTISSEASRGVPTLFYVDQTVPVSVWIWPTPIDNGFIRFQSRRLSADSNDTTKTPDLERYWAQYLIWELGHQLAVDNSLNMARVAHLAGIAQQKLQMCRAYSNPRGSFQMTVSHNTGWSR